MEAFLAEFGSFYRRIVDGSPRRFSNDLRKENVGIRPVLVPKYDSFTAAFGNKMISHDTFTLPLCAYHQFGQVVSFHGENWNDGRHAFV